MELETRENVKMLIVRFEGGLGNQLFQYAFLEYLKLNNSDVYADVSDYVIHRYHNGYEIEKVFGCEIRKAEKEQVLSMTMKHDNFVVRALEKALRIRICKQSEFYELDRSLIIEPVSIGIDTYFSGYWQNVHYVEAVQGILREKLKFREALQGKNRTCYECFKGMNTVSVHVRRADYLKNKNLGGICDKSYYVKAMEYMVKRLPKPVFLVFSDDIEWCKREFGSADKYYIDWNTGKDSFLDMYLMSLCKNNIIANSTFSWWGAWLNANSEKIVIMPKQWTRFSDSKLMSPGWIRM